MFGPISTVSLPPTLSFPSFWERVGGLNPFQQCFNHCLNQFPTLVANTIPWGLSKNTCAFHTRIPYGTGHQLLSDHTHGARVEDHWPGQGALHLCYLLIRWLSPIMEALCTWGILFPMQHAEDTGSDQGHATFGAWCKKQVPGGVFLFYLPWFLIGIQLKFRILQHF